MRARVVVALTALVAALLAGCSTTVTGAGRPGAAATGAPASGSSSPGASPSPSASPTDAADVWDDVAGGLADLPAVAVTGSFSGAAFGETTDTGAPTIQATYGTADGYPVAQAVVTTPVGTAEVRAVGGSAWAEVSGPLLQALGYEPAEVTAAADRWALLTDDDAGLDVFASLTAFLQICAPDGEDDLTADETTVDGEDAVVLASELAGGSVTVTLDPPRLLRSEYSGDDLTFTYPDTPPAVEAPPADQVVSVPDF